MPFSFKAVFITALLFLAVGAAAAFYFMHTQRKDSRVPIAQNQDDKAGESNTVILEQQPSNPEKPKQTPAAKTASADSRRTL